MAAKKNKSRFLFLFSILIIIIVGLTGAFFIGSKLSRANQGEVEKLVANLKDGIDANTKLIGANKSGVANSMRKISSLNASVTRDLKATKAGVANAGKGMIYVDKILGLKWATRRDNGHRYCLIPYPLPWHMAQDFATKIGGNLVIINDEKENQWLTKTFGSKTEFWIGLTDEVDEGKWLWVNGQDSVYTNWAKPEPDNYRKMQHHAIMNKQAARGATQAGKWNDISGNEIKIGIIEANR